MQPAQPVHRPLVTISSKRCFQCSFSGAITRSSSGIPLPVWHDLPDTLSSMTGPIVVLAHQGGWDEMLFVLVPLLVFLTLQWLNRRKLRQQEDDRPPRSQ